MTPLQPIIDSAWENRASLSPATTDRALREAIEHVIAELDAGRLRVAEKSAAGWTTHQWIKKAVLLSFRLQDNAVMLGASTQYYDKVPTKFGAYSAADFASGGFRVVPPAVARRGAFIARNVVLMPSYVNIGAWVGENTLVDTWATVASCAQIGARVHLSGGVGIGGVLEPPNARPVVVEDDAFIGSRCMVTDGARVGKGSVLGSGTILNPSIPVIDAETGEEISRGIVPAWCVAVSASRRRQYPGGEFFLPCVLVIKRLTEGERHDKAQLNDVLRTHGVST
jgi:2,3,4,5-tetrahydropyridine-2-carboxylate N-succinyltransferase